MSSTRVRVTRSVIRLAAGLAVLGGVATLSGCVIAPAYPVGAGVYVQPSPGHGYHRHHHHRHGYYPRYPYRRW